MPTVTGGWSGLWNRVGNEQHALLIPHDYNTIGGTLAVRGHAMARRINKIMMTRGGRIAAESVFDGFADSYQQVASSAQPGNPIVNGGKIAITTHTPVVVTIGNSQNQVEKTNIPRPSYPEDKSGNGGGGKVGLKL